MNKKIDIKFDKDLDYIIELKGELVSSRKLMDSKDSLDQYTGANLILCAYINKYNNLSENAKIHLNENINQLEKKAVEVLVELGQSKLVDKNLLKKYGYFTIKKTEHIQNSNTK